ncbi:hypothetical protein BJX70DRAFT_234384 [Aspergillus crustosus]
MGDFLFVDYQHDNPRNRSLKRQKQVFAQRTYQRKRRLAAVERLRTPSSTLRQRLPLSYEPVTLPESNRAEPSDSGINAEDEVESGGADVQQLIPVANLSSSPKILLGQGFIDPFSTSPFPMTDFMNSYFHQLRNFTIPNAYPLDKSRMSVWWWQQGISQPVIHLALLVSAAAHQTAMHTVHNGPSKYLQQSVRELLRLQGKMIKILNGLLQNPDTAQSAVLIVASLRAIEAIQGNIEATAAHTKGLEVLIQLNGGIEALDHMTLSKIYHGEILRAALTNSPFTLPITTTWRDEILQEMKLIHSNTNINPVPQLGQDDKTVSQPSELAQLAQLGHSFFRGSWYQGLETSMKHLLLISRRLIQYYEVARLHPSLVMPTDNDLFVVLAYQLISTRYQATPSTTATSTSAPASTSASSPQALTPAPTPSPLNEPLRITLFIYLNIRVWNFQVFPIMKSIVKPLQQTLLFPAPITEETTKTTGTTEFTLLSHLKQSAPEILFWILFIGGMASLGHEEHAWFVAHLTEISLYMGIDNWETAREILGGFFYAERPGQGGGEELWGEVMTARNKLV